jgi:hypothetical protein
MAMISDLELTCGSYSSSRWGIHACANNGIPILSTVVKHAVRSRCEVPFIAGAG